MGRARRYDEPGTATRGRGPRPWPGRRHRGRQADRPQTRDLPAGVAHGATVWDETIGVGGYASRGCSGDRSCGSATPTVTPASNCTSYNADQPAERLNVADTVKVQWQAYLGAGAVLLSGPGPGADDDRRRHQRAPRRSVRRVHGRTTPATAPGRSTGPRPAPGTCWRSPPAATASARATCTAGSTCSSGSRVGADG